MSKYTPNSLSGDLAPVNAELQKIKTALDSHLDRNPDSGQANQMDKDLDLNSKRILNLPEPQSDNEPARKKDVGDSKAYSEAAQASATAAASSESNASTSESNSFNAATAAQAAQTAAEAAQAGAEGAVNTHINDAVGAHASTAISYENAGTSLTSTDTQNAITELDAAIQALPAPMQFKGGIDLSTGDAGLPASPQEGWTYTVTVAGTITATKAGETPTAIPVQQNDQITYDATGTQWWVFDSAASSYTPVKNVSTPYTLTSLDSGYWIVFNDAGAATLNIPDGLVQGTSALAVNVGGGAVSVAMTGSDVIRANGASGSAATLADAFSYMAVTKIASTTWQGSER